ncbi:MAG: hypothetical protein WED05_11965 [Candidatus Atabeyarchaeum deiterrae]
MSRATSIYYRYFVGLMINMVILLVVYLIAKAVTGAGAFFDIVAIISIIILVIPESLSVTGKLLSFGKSLFLVVELLIVFSLVGSEWLAWQIAIAIVWIKIFNILLARYTSRFEFQTVREGYRRRITLRKREGEDEKPGVLRHKAVSILLIVFLVGIPLTFAVMQGTTAVLANANYFDSMVEKRTGYPSFFVFNSSDVRLVTTDVAYAKAKQHMASFGSNVQVENIHIAIWDDKLVWTMTVVQQYWLGAGYDQHVYGYIVLSATDPNEAPLLVHQELALASGTGLNNRKDILLQAYYRDPNYKYDRAILTKTPDSKLVYCIPKYSIDPSLQMQAFGVDVWDAVNGAYLESYNLTSMPKWIPQPYDEGWLENQITNWGSSRRGSSFDIFAGGFIGISVSNDRVAMDEDTRFLRYGDEMISFTSMHPYATEQTLTGIFISDHTGIRYYDVSQSNMLSGSRAKDVIQSQLYKPSAGEFVVEMPILYNMSSYLSWLSPVYYVTGDTWQLKYIGIVNALDQSDVVVQDVTGMSGQMGVEAATASFISLVSSKQNLGVSIHGGTITGKWSYEVAGNTNYYINATYNSTWSILHGVQANMPTIDWTELVICSIGNHINCTFVVVGSTNEIIRFDDLEF